MRLDKYLKVSRLIKRRTIAKDIAENQRIYINERIAKPSSEVKINDIIKIVYGTKVIGVKVLDVTEYAKKDEAKLMYEIVLEETNNN